MKLSISNIAWTQEDDAMMYNYLQHAGYQGLEIAPTRIFEDDPYGKLAQARQFGEMLSKEYGLRISSMQSICFGRDEAIFGTEEERKSISDYIKKAADFANEVKCSNLVFGSPKNRIIGTGQYDLALQFFEDIANYANKKNTFIAIEANPEIYGTNFLTTTEEAVTFIKDLNCGGIKLNLDLGTVIHNNEDLQVVSDNINLINHVHISEPFLDVVKERALHLELAEILKHHDYAGYVSVEMKNCNDVKVVKEVMTYIKYIFG